MAATDPDRLREALARRERTIAVLAGLLVALAGALVFALARGRSSGGFSVQNALQDEGVHGRVVEELVQRGQGLWDSHNDPDVGRVLQPRLRERESFGSRVSSNRLGLRERDFELPKPADLVRVVILGDSLVFGEGVDADERMGALLEKDLRRANRSDLRVEVLHLGIGSWNIVAESAWLRRQLGLLQPDLVFHLVTSNDLDDSDGVRGFGGKAGFSPHRRERADSRVIVAYPRQILGAEGGNNLLLGLDHESRSRWTEAREAILRLRECMKARQVPYVVWGHFGGLNGLAHQWLTADFAPEELLFNSLEFAHDRGYWVSDGDPHWNPKGMAFIEKVLFGAILDRDLLPQLALKPSEEALELYRSENLAAWRQTLEGVRVADYLRTAPVSQEFVTAAMPANAASVNGGLDKDGLVSPYASFLLANLQGGSLFLTGRALDRPEIDGTHVQVSVDELPLGTFELHAGERIEQGWALPAEVAERPFLGITLQADDYCYVGNDLQHCVVFALESLAIR